MENETQAWYQERWFVISAAFMCAVVALGIVTLALSAFGSGSVNTPGVGAASAPARARVKLPLPGGSAANPGACDLPAGEQALPTSDPGGSWVTVGETQEPQSKTVGPQKQLDGVNICFAHSPLGALYAAVNVEADGSYLPEKYVLGTLTAPSRVRSELLLEGTNTAGGFISSDGADGRFQIAGFQIEDYTPAQENLELLIDDPTGELVAFQMTEAWKLGSWMLELPSGGQLPATPQSSISGFVTWGARR
jgi:hypothetical protein